MSSLELKIPPLALTVAFAALMWAGAHAIPVLGFTLPAGRLLGGGLAAAGVAIVLLGALGFRRARTTLSPLRPASASALVVSGIYRWTRNPMYLGMLLVLLGWALALTHGLALALAAVFIPTMNRLQILPEERVLAARFGADFAAYQARVRRWL